MICGTCKSNVTRVTTVITDGKPRDFCRECPTLTRLIRKVSTFPYTLPFGLGGGETSVTVNSLRHLRQLERRHGVACQAYNDDESHWGGPAPEQGPRPRRPEGYGSREAVRYLQETGRG